MKDLFEYRASARDAYASWSIELDRLPQQLLDVPADRFNVEAAKLIVSQGCETTYLELRHEMASTRDKLFGDLIKTVTKWELPTVSLAYLTSLSITGAIAAFAAALDPHFPAVVDYYVQERRKLARHNSLSYLVGVSAMLEDECS